MDSKNRDVYYENKTFTLVTALLVLCGVSILTVATGIFYLLPIPVIMIIVVFLYPSAKITLTEDGLVYKKGRKNISVKWSEVIGVHQDPVFSPNPISFYFSNKFRMGGFFIETTQGFTDYIGAVGENKWSANALRKEELIKQIENRSSHNLQTGAVSILKQKQKLWDIILILAAIFIVPLIIMGLYGAYAYFTGDDMLKYLIFGIR